MTKEEGSDVTIERLLVNHTVKPHTFFSVEFIYDGIVFKLGLKKKPMQMIIKNK